MAKLLGPDFISLQVRDLPASRKFYTELLGLPVDPAFNVPNFVLFDSTTIPFGITQATVDLGEIAQPGLGIALWLDCDQVDELWAKLAAANASILQAPFDGPFGRTFSFTDPDGYRITANQNDWERFPLGGKAETR